MLEEQAEAVRLVSAVELVHRQRESTDVDHLDGKVRQGDQHKTDAKAPNCPRFCEHVGMIAIERESAHQSCTPEKRKAPGGNPGALHNPGDVLLSHAVAHAVSLAMRSLTAVFGMGTGVSSAL